MTSLLSPRLWLAVILAVAITFTHVFVYRAGRSVIRADWETERAKIAQQVAQAEAAARAKEQHLADQNRKITDAYQAEKQRRAADARAADDALRVLNAALDAAREATSNAAAIGRVDGEGNPTTELFRESAAALVTLGKEADRLAGKVRALQDYADRVCVK